MKYVVRQGKKKGRGAYFTWSPCPGDPAAMICHYTRRKGRAWKFDTKELAENTAAMCFHITSFRVVKLTKKDERVLGC